MSAPAGEHAPRAYMDAGEEKAMTFEWMGAGGPARGREADDWYDVRQVCLNGHEITNYAQSQPASQKKLCNQCGAATIMCCQNCSTSIQGYHHLAGVIYADESEPPKFCAECGKPFPWQVAAVENLEEILRESGISDTDLDIFEKSLSDIVSETPRTESAALKFKRVLGKLGEPAYKNGDQGHDRHRLRVG